MYVACKCKHFFHTWLSQKTVGDREKILTNLNSALKATLGLDIFLHVPQKS